MAQSPQHGHLLPCLLRGQRHPGGVGAPSGNGGQRYLLTGFELFWYFSTQPYLLVNTSPAINKYLREQLS